MFKFLKKSDQSYGVENIYVKNFLEATKKTIIISNPFPPGAISSDRSAIVGKNDWLFLFQGSNRYMDQYQKDIKRINIQKNLEWRNIFKLRKQAVEKSRSKFFQLIIPNKLSIYPKHSPHRLRYTITPTLKELLHQKNSSVLCPLKEFINYSKYGDIFRRNDSHLNFFGQFYLYKYICEEISLDFDYNLFNINFIKTVQPGDLGSKFEPQICESLSAPEHMAMREMLDANLEWKFDNSQQYTPFGKHNGIRIVTRCNSAKNDIKLLVFGNSFCDHPFSWGFSYFLSQSVKEYHFVWSPNINIAYLNHIKPDIVLAQTCERFLQKLPLDTYQ